MKLLTEQMVQDALEKLGLTEEQLVADDAQVSDKIMEHYDCRISDNWEEQDLYIYEESTADGYSAYICTHNPNNICINEDVYQYKNNSEVTDRFEDAIRNGLSIYCDDVDFIEEAFEGMMDTFLDDVRAEVEQEFHDKGYVWPAKIPTLLSEIKTMLIGEGLDKHQKTVDKINAALEQLKIAD